MNARNQYDKELINLNLDLVKMSTLAEGAIAKAVTAFRNHDKALAHTVVQNDNQIDDMEKQIEARCLSIIIRQQPVAGDLRRVSTALKMITDLERIGDNAADIAELSIKISGDYIFDIVQHIPLMAETAVKMLNGAIDAFVNRDIELAKKIIEEDDVVDELFCKVKADMTHALKSDKDTGNNSVDLLMIAKYLERIADHTVNLCEWVLFLETGVHKDKKILG